MSENNNPKTEAEQLERMFQYVSPSELRKSVQRTLFSYILVIVALAHELHHGYNYFEAYNSYNNAETKGVIKIAEDKISRVNDRDYEEQRTSTTGLEPAVAKYYNNATRSGHQTPIGIFYVGCITCTTPLAPPTETAKTQIENTNKALK